MPCEEGVNIPGIMSLYNDLYASNAKEMAKALYSITYPPDQQASACIECGKCEEKCPQHIEIRDELKKAHTQLYQEGLAQH
jgi:predicted aldo/keto reductase-like oxidoreductase